LRANCCVILIDIWRAFGSWPLCVIRTAAAPKGCCVSVWIPPHTITIHELWPRADFAPNSDEDYKVAAAIAALQAYRPQARNVDALETFIAYLEARAPWIPNYRQRRIERTYIGSGHVEKANDLSPARLS
jgi:hypothetical protein